MHRKSKPNLEWYQIGSTRYLEKHPEIAHKKMSKAWCPLE